MPLVNKYSSKCLKNSPQQKQYPEQCLYTHKKRNNIFKYCCKVKCLFAYCSFIHSSFTTLPSNPAFSVAFTGNFPAL